MKFVGRWGEKRVAYKAKTVADDGTFTGYGSVFGNLDAYREIVAPGAFKASLEELSASGDPLPALWQHSGGEPIGGYSKLAEDERGLLVEGFLLVNEVARAREAHALMKARVVKGLSIGYYVRADSYDEKERIRTLTDLELVEISVVTFPANPEAQIDAMKQIVAERSPTVREFEAFLRDAGGFSKAAATVIAGRGLPAWADRGDPDADSAQAIVEAVKSFDLSECLNIIKGSKQ